MAIHDKKHLKKLRREEKKKQARLHQRNQGIVKKKDYAWGRFAILTVIGIVLLVIVLLNLFK